MLCRRACIGQYAAKKLPICTFTRFGNFAFFSFKKKHPEWCVLCTLQIHIRIPENGQLLRHKNSQLKKKVITMTITTQIYLKGFNFQYFPKKNCTNNASQFPENQTNALHLHIWTSVHCTISEKHPSGNELNRIAALHCRLFTVPISIQLHTLHHLSLVLKLQCDCLGAWPIYFSRKSNIIPHFILPTYVVVYRSATDHDAVSVRWVDFFYLRFPGCKRSIGGVIFYSTE